MPSTIITQERVQRVSADPVADKLARLEAKPTLRIDHVDYDLRDPDAVRSRLAAPLAYSQRVEALVTGLSIETLLPRTSDDGGYIHRFLTVWEPDEQGHALALEQLLVQLGLEPTVARRPRPRRQGPPGHQGARTPPRGNAGHRIEAPLGCPPGDRTAATPAPRLNGPQRAISRPGSSWLWSDLGPVVGVNDSERHTSGLRLE
jgi:hypothetical protein